MDGYTALRLIKEYFYWMLAFPTQPTIFHRYAHGRVRDDDHPGRFFWLLLGQATVEFPAEIPV